MKKILIALIFATQAAFGASQPHSVATEGKGAAPTDGYTPPIIGNGSICTSVDYLGGQAQRKYVNYFPEVVWAGRRTNLPFTSLSTMGHFECEISVDGAPLGEPISWRQTLNTTEAYTECEVEYASARVKTVAFVPYGYDMLVVKKTVAPKSGGAKTADVKFKYKFTDKDSTYPPARTIMRQRQYEAQPNSASLFYRIFGHKDYNGEISATSSAPAKVITDNTSITLESHFDLSKGDATSAYFVTYADDFNKGNREKNSAALKKYISEKGFEGIFSDHKQNWKNFWGNEFVSLPDAPMQDAYQTGLYHLRTVCTKWSFPVGLMGHGAAWSGRFFGFDEMFAQSGAVSAGKFDISVRTPNFRKDLLPVAMRRVQHYSDNSVKKFGARYAWESLEDGSEGAPNPAGFWIDHVFHMANIANSCWKHYLYTGDKKFLEETAYPVIRECAAFYYSHMLYEDAEGRTIFGRCTDIERLGPAVLNAFMSSCGAIYNFEIAARAAEILGVDSDYASKLLAAAKGLRASLPHDGEMYLPFEGCKEKSFVSITGLYPYTIFDEREKKQVAALYDFMKNISKAGNMYPVGNKTCTWYAGILSSALANIRDCNGPETMLSATAQTTGKFGETWEINEPGIRSTPWFTTSAGSYVHAVNQMLVNPRENGEVDIAVAASPKWKDYSFELPSYGGARVKAKVENGKFASLEYIGGKSDSQKRTLVVPKRLMPADKISKDWEAKDKFFKIPINGNFSL